MSSHVHIALYDALREAGASEEKARAAAGAIPAGEHLATKQDIAELKVSFTGNSGSWPQASLRSMRAC